MWKFIIAGYEGNCELFGVNIFDFPWEKKNTKIIVSDPIYNQRHEMSIYEVTITGEKHLFAAGEFSNGVFGFYIND